MFEFLSFISNAGTGIVYVIISAGMARFVMQRRDLPLQSTWWLYVAFIFACGLHHLAMTRHVVSEPLTSLVTTAMFIVSAYTLYRLPDALKIAKQIPSPEELLKANRELEEMARKSLETQQHNATLVALLKENSIEPPDFLRK